MSLLDAETPRPTETETYRSSDLIRVTGVTFRNLDYWVRLGYITPTVAPGIGSGYYRLFSAADRRLVEAFVAGRRLGIELETVAAAVRDRGVARRLRDFADDLLSTVP